MDESRLSVEEKIRLAQMRGAFDDLPGSGRPLDLRDADDPDWWIKRLVRREGIDMVAVTSPTAALRREADTFPEALTRLRSEDRVRAALADFNERVEADWRRPLVGPTLPLVARKVAVEPMVERWRALRAEHEAEERRRATEAAAQHEVRRASEPARRRWALRRRRRDATND